MTNYSIRDAISVALQDIGVDGADQDTDGADIALGLYKIQTILDSFNLDGGLIYAQTTSLFPILTSKPIYTIGPQLDNPGSILSLNETTLIGGAGYVPGSYTVSLTGGTGSGAFATVTVDLTGIVIDATILTGGNNYIAGDTLTGTILGGTGWSINVQEVTAQTDFVIPTRPQNLLFAAFQPTSTSPAIDIPMREYTSREFAAIVSKNVGSGVPQIIYLDKSYPQGNLKLWNFPNQGGVLVLTYWQLLPAFSITLDTIIQNTFPPGFTRLIELECAQELCRPFNRLDMIPGFAATIADIKRKMLVNNIESEWAKYDVPGPGVYDARSGTSWR